MEWIHTDNFKEYQTFVLYASYTTECAFAVNREGLYVCYTMYMSPVELPSHFMRARNVVAKSTVAQNMAKYTKWKVQAATLAKSVWVLCLLEMPKTLFIMV